MCPRHIGILLVTACWGYRVSLDDSKARVARGASC